MRRLYLPWPHHPDHPGVVAPTRVDPAGRRGPTPAAARGPSWRTVGPGWFVPAAAVAEDTDQRIVEAALHLPAHGAVTGWAALAWRGARWFDGAAPGATPPCPVALITGGGGQRSGPGFTVTQERLPAEHVEVVDGLRVTTAARAVVHEMCRARDDDAAVVVLEMACYGDHTSIDEVAAVTAGLGPLTGIERVRRATALADENAWSPPETRMRLLWQRAGATGLLTNTPIFAEGRHLRTPDLLHPGLGVVAEYDGSTHLDLGSKQADVRRDDCYRRHGLEQAVMTAADLADPTAFLARLAAAEGRARLRPVTGRSWTLEPPPWWTNAPTVAARRALDERQRRRILRYRSA